MKIAIIEDDINMRKSLETALESKKIYKIVSYKSAIEALGKLEEDIEIIIVDINMPKMDGITFLKKLNRKYDAIVITGNATLNLAIEALRLGAKDFIKKPFEIDTLIKSIENIVKVNNTVKNIAIKNKSSKEKEIDFVGTSKPIENVIKIADKVAITDATVLLLGESGVGKEVFTKYIYQKSNRNKAPFVAVNMAAIPDNLLESELFGYEKGAFTDAKEARAGKFEMANNGTLFLDEIGEMPISLQAKLLRAIQEKEIQRLGSSKSIKIDVRIISATNASLQDKIKDGEFREDLYYRLNTIPIIIPPLRDRKDEILDIAENVLKNVIKKYSLESKVLSKMAQKELIQYYWPGNIRELISVIERSAILSDKSEIGKKDLFLEARH
jgi:two-component system NtrC family response regulator